MSRTEIKVCGLTSASDARLCAELGVNMLGLNFSSQSARCISGAQAREIVGAVRKEFPETKLIGLFVDQPLDLVQSAIDKLGLDGVRGSRATIVRRVLQCARQFA